MYTRLPKPLKYLLVLNIDHTARPKVDFAKQRDFTKTKTLSSKGGGGGPISDIKTLRPHQAVPIVVDQKKKLFFVEIYIEKGRSIRKD